MQKEKCTCFDRSEDGKICKLHTFGFESSEECEVCGKHNNNQIESRFLYTVCEEHQNIAPINIKKEKEKNLR